MEHLIVAGYAAAGILYAATLTASLFKREGICRMASAGAVAFNVLVLAVIFLVSGQPPVFEIFGGLLFSSFVLGLLGVFACPRGEERMGVGTWVWMEVLLLFAVTLFFQKEPPAYRFHHSCIWVILFHGFRGLALAFALFSAAHFIRFRMEPERRRAGNPLFRQGRNFLLLSAVAFLCGEYAGIVWCQKGWGDFWHWSPAFFQSTLIILCLMFAFHVPGKNPRSDDLRSIIAVLTPVLMLTVAIAKGAS